MWNFYCSKKNPVHTNPPEIHPGKLSPIRATINGRGRDLAQVEADLSCSRWCKPIAPCLRSCHSRLGRRWLLRLRVILFGDVQDKQPVLRANAPVLTLILAFKLQLSLAIRFARGSDQNPAWNLFLRTEPTLCTQQRGGCSPVAPKSGPRSSVQHLCRHFRKSFPTSCEIE